MRGIRLIFSWLLLSLISSAHSEVFRWTDDKGVTHFSDCPQGLDCELKQNYKRPQVDLPVQQDSAVTSPSSAEQRSDDEKEHAGTEAPQATVETEVALACFSPATQILTTEQADVDQSIKPRQLSRLENHKLGRILKQMLGRWRGQATEIVCEDGHYQAQELTNHYSVSMKAYYDRYRVLQLELEFEDWDRHSEHNQEAWLLLKKDRLRFGDIATIQADAPQWDIELVVLDDARIDFIRKFRRSSRFGASQRFLELRSFQIEHKRLRLKELTYLQDRLIHSRSLYLKKL